MNEYDTNAGQSGDQPAQTPYDAPTYGQTTSGQPAQPAQPTYGDQPAQPAAYGQPTYGTQGESYAAGQSGYGQSAYGQPAYGAPTYGTQGETYATGQSGYGQPSYGQPAGQPSYGQPYGGAYSQQSYSGYAQPAPQVPYGYVPRQKLVAGLLGIFLGSLGVHNFYLGFTGKAIAQLLLTLLGWIVLGLGPLIAGIWGLVEGILILCSNYGTQWHIDARGVELRD